jgi:potassium-transporting ATPase KdpC subunit
MTSTSATQPIDAPVKRKTLLIIYGVLLAIFLAPIVRNIYDHLSQPEIVIPDEQIAGEKLLAEKFTGPRYFQPDPAETVSASSPDRYYISVASARAQVVRIASERKLSDSTVKKLDDVIEKISEPPPSRVRGRDSVNTLRLNLALDQIR